MKPIKRIAVMTPRSNESALQVARFFGRLDQAVAELNTDRENGNKIDVRYYLINAGEPDLEDIVPLVQYAERRHLTHTLIDGYTAILAIEDGAPDVIVRLDIDEGHNVGILKEIIATLEWSAAEAAFVSVVPWHQGEPRSLMSDIMGDIARFHGALPIVDTDDKETICEVYSDRFLDAYQAFRREVLAKIIGNLRLGANIIKKGMPDYEPPAGWLDLLAILSAAEIAKIDFLFGGWKKLKRDSALKTEQLILASVALDAYSELPPVTPG